MVGKNRFLKTLSAFGLLLLAAIGIAQADDATAVSAPPITQPSTPAQQPPSTQQLEPIDFIDNPRPKQPDTMNRRPEPAAPAGWGSAVFSQDGQFVATVSTAEGKEPNSEVMVWGVADPSKSVRYEQTGRIVVVAFSADGKWLAIGPQSPQSGVKLVDTKTGEVGQTLPGAVARTNALAWSHDGTQLALASTSDKTVRVWNVAEKKFIKAYEPDASKLFAVAFTSTGQLLAAGAPAMNGDGLGIFDVTAGELVKTLKGHKELIEAAEFSADGRWLASVGWDAMVRIWDVDKGEEASVIKGHKKGIRAVAISREGKRLASSNDREFKLWDGEKKELLDDLGPENSGAKFLAISPDGAWLASITRDGTARIWDVEKKTEKIKLDRNAPPITSKGDAVESSAATAAPSSSGDAPEPEAVHALAYSRDGKWIALAREDGKIAIRNADDGKLAREFDGFGDVAACVVFSPDSQQIAAGSFDKSIRIWNLADSGKIVELKGHGNWVFSVAFSVDGKTLASGSYDKTVKLWNIADAKEIASLAGHTAGVRSVCFTTDAQHLVSGSADRTAIVWSLADHQPIATLKGHAAAVRAVACSPDGETVATASEDSTIKLWRTGDWTERASLPGTDGVMFWCLAFSPAGRTLAAGAFNGTVKLYDPVNGKERKTLQGPTDAITAVAFAPGAREIVAGSVDKSIHRWKSETGAAALAAAKKGENAKTPELKPTEAATALNAVLLNTQQPILSLVYSQDGKRLAVGAGLYRTAGSLQLWDVANCEKLWQSDEYRFGLPAVSFSTDEKRIAIGNFADNFLRFIDVANGKLLKEVRGHRGKITGIAFSPNGKYFATASLDRELKLWNASTNKEVRSFTGHADFVYSIAFSPDGRRLLSGSYDRTARLWDVENGNEIAQLKGHQGTIQQSVYSHDGLMIATASSDRTVRIYDSAAGDFLLTLRGHQQKVESVAFAPNGKLIATGSSDRTIRFWNPASGTELLKMTQDGVVRVVTFSPDGKHLASGCDDKTVKLWEIAGLASQEPSDAATQTP